MGLLSYAERCVEDPTVTHSHEDLSLRSMVPTADVKSTVIYLTAVTAYRCLPAAAEVLYRG